MSERKILIIDDDENVALMLKDYFESQNITVSVAGNMHEALDIHDDFSPDLIFLDYRMSPHTGKDVLERLKIIGNKAPVIMMSAYKRREGVFEMKNLGAAEYIEKPYNFDEIDSIVEKYINSPA